MTDERLRKAPVVQFRITPERTLAKIREIAASSDRVIIGNHAIERMSQRGITTTDVFRVLQAGHIEGQIERGKGKGEWKCKIVKPIRGKREVGVVTIILISDELFVKTVEWEDLR